MRLRSASSESGSEDDSIIRLVCLRVQVVPLVARAVLTGHRCASGAYDVGGIGACGSVVCGRFKFVHVLPFT